MSQPVILIDASGWLFRAYHGLPPLTNARGEPTGAVYGMVNMLRKLLRDYKPEEIAVVFDAPGKSFREDIYAEYKANRDATPEDLSAQFPVIVEFVQALGLPLLQIGGVEADDVIGTLTAQARAAGRDVLIVTSDKDMAQLVDDHVVLLDTMKNRRMDPAGVEEKFGVPPERIVDYLALVGDTSDNIPGIPGVGPKTAAKWLKEYGSLDAIIARAAEVGGKVGDNLRAGLHQLPMARDLATIRLSVELPQPLQALKTTPADSERLAAIYRQCSFHKLLEELQSAGGPAFTDTTTTDTAGTAVASANAGAVTAAVEEPERPTSPRTRATAVLDEVAFADLLAQLEGAALICLDTETDSLDAMRANLVGLSFAIEAGSGWYVPVAHRYLGVPEQLPRDEVLRRLKPVLENPHKPKVGQHIKYDLKVLARHGIAVQGVAFDTMLESYVLDAGGNRHDMDTLAEKYLNHRTIHYEDVTGKGKTQITFDQVAIDKAADYSAEDADITLRLHQTLYPRLGEIDSLKRVFETIEMPLVPVLTQIESTGVKVDGPLLGRISTELAQRMQELQQQVFAGAGGEFNLGSPKQLQQVLYEKLQLPVLGKTPKGDPSTAEDVLEQLAASHALPRLILDWRGVSKLRSTYAETLPLQINPHTGRIHTSYHQAVASTGRLSSADPNLQNIPIRTAEGRRIREAFIADQGRLLLSVDYSQIELRLMAHFSRDERLQEAFHKGHDIHRATAAEVFGLPLDEVASEQRRAAKAINFGLIYGISSFGLARQLGIARGEAQAYMDLFFQRYPGVKRFMDDCRAQAHERGYVETLFGRRLYLREINSRNAAMRAGAERVAINAPLQGTAADLIKIAMIELHGWLQRQAPQTRMIMQVHDELVFEGPEDELRAQAQAIADRMCALTKLAVPLAAEWGLGHNWDAAHESQGHAQST